MSEYILDKNNAYFESCAGVLYISKDNPGDNSFALSSWNKGFEFYKKEGFSWVYEPNDPPIQLLTHRKKEDVDSGLEKFVNLIPKKIKAFASNFKYRQMTLLRILQSSSEYPINLMEEAPVLLWVLADWKEKKKLTRNQIDSLVSGKRIEIIRLIYGYNSKAELRAVDRFIKKIKLSRYDFMEFSCIDRTIRSIELIKKMKSFDQIHVTLLSLLRDKPELIQAKWLRHFPQGSYYSSFEIDAIHEIYQDSLGMVKFLEDGDAKKKLNNCSSLEEMESQHDSLVGSFNEKMYEVKNKTPFPKPPIPGNGDIQPIRTLKDLVDEGNTMNHCVAMYQDQVYKGYCYIYRVLKPERGTLLLRKVMEHWQFGEFSLANNIEPKNESKKAVNDWLESVRI